MFLTKEIVTKCRENFLSLEELIYLYGLVTDHEYDLDISTSVVNKLRRQGYLNNAQITQEGAEVVALIVGTSSKIDKEYSKEFEQFWKAFPANDALGGKLTRKLKGNKPLTYTRYKQALARGYSSGEIYTGLINHIEFLNSTISSMKNPFTYMKACHNWLDSNEFLEYHQMEETPVRSKLWK